MLHGGSPSRSNGFARKITCASPPASRPRNRSLRDWSFEFTLPQVRHLFSRREFHSRSFPKLIGRMESLSPGLCFRVPLGGIAHELEVLR